MLAFFVASIMLGKAQSQGVLGYYRFPTLHGNSVVFTSEGDLWRVDAEGGLAQRLTSHPLQEDSAHISPDGKWIGFTASYEGPKEAYVMPIDGGVPTRCTYGESTANVRGWTPDGRLLYSTHRHSGMPDSQLCTYDLKSHVRNLIPLSQADEGTYSSDGKTLFFTRLEFQGSQTKRYKGGSAQNIWRWDGGDSEAVPLTSDFKGTSRNPMWWNGRVYFASDRDGVMNIWSMSASGHDLREHTHHTDYDVLSPDLDSGRIVYQHGADLWLLDLASGMDHPIRVTLSSDFDQMRERWVKDPLKWTTSAHLSPDGSKIALTARGQIFVAPAKQGRLVEVTRNKSVRYRDAMFLPDNKSLVALSDESGEVELWKLPSGGTGDGSPERLTNDSVIMRLMTKPSPDGKWIAHSDKNHKLFLYDCTAKTDKEIASSDLADITDLAWSADSKCLAFSRTAKNTFDQIELYSTITGTACDVTTDRFNSGSPAFSPDGKYLYFLSDRHLVSTVSSPWGAREPEPFFDKRMEVYFVALQPGLRSPFQPDDELQEDTKPLVPKKDEADKKPALPTVVTDGIADRLQLAPLPPGDYDGLTVCGDRLFFQSAPSAEEPAALASVVIRNKKIKIETVLPNVASFETTQDGKKILARVGSRLMVFDANGAPPDPTDSNVNLADWSFSFDPKEEWREMFDEAWRMHRDYFYASNMHGVNWKAMLLKYRPMVDRVTDRAELSDLLAQMVGEISVLHTFVESGDVRQGTDNVEVGQLGADWTRDEAAGGYRLTRVYETDPDDPEHLGPLQKPEVHLANGDVITMVDGVSALSAPELASLLRSKGGQQVRLRVLIGGDKSKTRDVIVTPFSRAEEASLQYSDWEYSRRKQVERLGKGALGYVHLRAMGAADIDQWARDFYPVFDRQGLIIDVRHNDGGNIDSWILEKLLRKAWMYMNQHSGAQRWLMQYAFRGKIVVLCDEFTSSDGEAFSEGFKRLGLGKVIGTRTWGGEVWLKFDNILVDSGIASAPEMGVYGPEGKWLVEGHGVEPDIEIDNLPHATFLGKDAQLERAIRELQEEIAKDPNPVPPVPAFPDKSFPTKKPG